MNRPSASKHFALAMVSIALCEALELKGLMANEEGAESTGLKGEGAESSGLKGTIACG